MPVITFTDTALASLLRDSLAANVALAKAQPILEALTPEARAWVLRKLAERLGVK